MNASETPSKRRWWQSRWFLWTGGTVLFLLLAAFIALLWVAKNTEPILRARVIQTLSTRFHSHVELDELHISFISGLEVTGKGLRIAGTNQPNQPNVNGGHPMMTIRSFRFATGLQQLLEPNMHVERVEVDGAELRIPPRQARGPLTLTTPKRRTQPLTGILVDKILFNDFKLIIETNKPGKVPLQFDISRLILTDVGVNKPFTFDAALHNPKPSGDIRTVGHFGPWQNDSPRDTPLDGSYLFLHADLGTIKGLGGTLSSTGTYAGLLDQITADGTTDTPDFRLTTGGHPMPLHTQFHAIVNGTTGDTTLQPVVARLGHSNITATGSVTRKPGVPGHDIELNVDLDKARIEDMLLLATKSPTPFMRGALVTRAHISIPPGTETVTHRMRLQGNFSLQQSTFSNAGLQQKIDELSMRAQGWPEKANPQQAPAVTSSMQGGFLLANEKIDISGLVYKIPGATVLMDGAYGLDGATLDFHGKVRTQATASEMVGGWKQLLIMPFDKYLKKNGAGVEVPIKLGGTQSDPKLALDYGHPSTVTAKPR